MIKQLFLAFLLYSIIWWVLFTLHFDYVDKREDKDYKRDGLNGYTNSLLYFILFSVIYVIIQILIENNDNTNKNETSTISDIGPEPIVENVESPINTEMNYEDE